MPSLKMHIEAYLDGCGFVLNRYKGRVTGYYCSNPKCNRVNNVQGIAQVWPCGAVYGGKPCPGQYYVWKHHAAAMILEAKSRNPEAERIRALKEKREREGLEDTYVSMADLTGRKMIPLGKINKNAPPAFYKGMEIPIWYPPAYDDYKPPRARGDLASFDSKATSMHFEPAPSPAQNQRKGSVGGSHHAPHLVPHASHTPNTLKGISGNKPQNLSSATFLPSTKDPRKHSTPAQHTSHAEAASHTRSSTDTRKAVKEEREPTPPALPPKDLPRAPKSQTPAHPPVPTSKSSKQHGSAAVTHPPLSTHHRTASTQPAIAPQSSKQHSSSRHVRSPSAQPSSSNTTLPQSPSNQHASSRNHRRTPSAQAAPPGAILPAPGSLAQRAVSPPPLRRGPDLHHMGSHTHNTRF